MLNRILLFSLFALVSMNLASAEGKARIVTSVARPVQCIAPISVYNIDGKLVRMNEMGFELEPGRHTLVGTANPDSTNCPTMRSGRSMDIPPLEYDFEAGKTYYIGLQHKSSNQQLWRFVVWRIENAPGEK